MEDKNININNLGGWSIDNNVLNYIIKNFSDKDTLLELGSGKGTLELVKFFNVFSIEDQKEWVGFSEDSEYIYAPIQQYNGYDWYDIEILKNKLPSNYDIILLDGPLGEKGREGFYYNIDLFKKDVPIIIDDTNREHEKRVSQNISNFLNKELIDKNKFSVIL